MFASLDAFKGFWQLSHDFNRQEISLLSDIGIFAPKRLVQGSTDAAHSFQSGMLESLGELVYQYVLIWIDDILVFDGDFKHFLGCITKVFVWLRKLNIKLKPKRSDLCARSITWCDRRIDKNGISYEGNFIRGLLDLPAPSNAAELEKFLGAANWMRSWIPEFANETFPLQELLKAAQKIMQSAKTSNIAGFKFTSDVWNHEINSAFKNVKAAIRESTQFSHPDPEKLMCLFTDASDDHRGILLTQVPMAHLMLPVLDQDHEPLGVLS